MLRRKANSSLVGQALAMAVTMGERVYTEAILSQIPGKRPDKVQVIIVTGSKNLEEAVYSSKRAEDPRLIHELAIIKEAGEQGTVAEVERVSREDRLGQAGSFGRGVLMMRMKGEYSLPV